MEKKEKNTPSQKKEQPNLAIRYTGIATKMAIIIGLGVYGGLKLDEQTKSEFPAWTLILSIISVFLAMYIIIKDSK